MKKFYAASNLLIIILVIAVNAWASVNGINGNTVGGVSDRYDSLFTPAGYAFAIWGIIFIGLIVLGVFQFRQAYFDKSNEDIILQIGPWLSLANIINILWLFAWLNERIGLSLILMFFLLSSLLMVIVRLNMERWDAPFPILAYVWWPICIYSGWIAVATVANVSAYLVSIEWQPGLSPTTWTVIMIVVAAAINLLMILLRNMREFAAVGIWALVAISIRHWDSIAVVQWTALISAGVLFAAISIHGYLNRATNPLVKYSEFRKSR